MSIKQELAAALARRIFEAPINTGTDKVQRIQFMGGKWPDRETDLGGLSEDALAAYIEQALDDLSGLVE